jgi:hypothetical protein
MSATYEFISKQVLSTTAASIVFSNIPQGFTDLLISVSARSNAAGADSVDLYAQFNEATSNYSMRRLFGNGSSAASDSASGAATSLRVGNMPGAAPTANTFGSTQVYISGYASSNNKTVSADSCSENNGTTALIMALAGLSTNAAPVTSVLLAPLSGSFVAGSSFFVYGVRRASGDPGVFMDASGGDVLISGGYKYHTFRSSGVLQVNTPGWAEYLVVAGGGSGGKTDAGGGGAGGLITGTLAMPSGPVSVVVGAGGANPGTGTVWLRGLPGSDSRLGGVTAVGGGGGGSGSLGDATNRVAGSGGSGGGAGSTWTSTANRGDGVSGQGNAGGTGAASQGGGGGGGAGAAGSNAPSSTQAGAGGVGRDVWGTFYAGGGGGGHGGAGATDAVGGNGGGGRGTILGDGLPATVNTGGGGGGGGGNHGNGGAGGSGIVIVRYPYR